MRRSGWSGVALRRAWLIMACMAGGSLAPGVAFCDPVAELDDAAARLQYAFYTADTSHLRSVLDLLERLEVPPALATMKEYYAAYGEWKLAQVHAEAALEGRNVSSSRKAANTAADACIRHAEATFKRDPAMAEAYGIHAVCSAFASGLLPFGQPSFAGCEKSKSMRMALQLDANNPRIELLEAICLGAESGSAATPIYDKLRKVVAGFESAVPVRSGQPDWGQAEALVLLGRACLQRGDALAARDAIERALILAPDYRQAQMLLQPAATRPR